MKLEERTIGIERVNNGFRVMPRMHDQERAFAVSQPMDDIYVYESIDKLAAALRVWDKNIMNARDGKPKDIK